MIALTMFLAQAQDWHSFEKIQLSDVFFSEGAGFADFDNDGHGDIASGPFIYFGPDFQDKVDIYPPAPFSTQGYSDNFFAFPHDMDGDGWIDLVMVGFPGQEAFWYRNPKGEVRDTRNWQRSLVLKQVDNESPQFEDLNGDGRPDLLCMTEGRLGWAEYDPQDLEAEWTFHSVGMENLGGKFTHGLGVGDLDGDGRKDLLMKQGWWTQPADADQQWEFTPFQFAGRGGAQMYTYDVDGDGDADVITADNAHGYGLAWFERLDPTDESQELFRKHHIMGATAKENSYSLVIGNLHAMDLIDMDGDGLKDLVTGARFWAHGGNDIADHEPALVFWFKLKRSSSGAEFIPFLIDDDSGVGTQVVAGDVDGDGLNDVVVGNKKGTFLHLHSVQSTTAADYRARLLQSVLANKDRVGGVRVGGIDPQGADGASLNLGFELGSLSGWSVEGQAFAQQPMKGDTVFQRRAPDRSRHRGEWWIGTFEVAGDGPTGTLTSDPFKVTHPFASFLIGGGAHANTCVQILDAANGDIIFQSSGKNDENMRSRWVDLRQRVGQEIQVRLIDGHTGGWGHINFDDFRFHSETDEIRDRAMKDMPRDMIKGFAPEEAAARMTLPDGFYSDLIAGEPRLHQPIAMTFDARGRIWVAEAYSYPVRRPDDEAKDHILVFEDTNNDGSYDKRTVFLDNLNLVSGIEVGFGGVWIGAAPYFMFVPDADDDLVPDSEPQVLLDGWGYQDTHETLNAFNWGPDGWLYGCHGVFTHSRVGKPGTPDADRIPMNAGVWRYHPTRHEFEVFAWGTSNPWGVDFDDRGQAVITACVIPHLYHMIQGGRYIRQGGRHFNPYVFDDIQTVADHLHYLGATPHSGNGNSDSVGGGHAHCGAAIYLADQFPPEYRNRLFLFNVHGKRMNSEYLVPKDSGLVGQHGPDFMIANDKWFLGVALRVGPDGSLYFIDWYDKQACHRSEVEIWDRSNGRLFRVRHGDLEPAQVDLQSLSRQELVEMQLHANDWYVRQARRILMERGAHAETAESIYSMLNEEQQTEKRLRLLWALHAVDGLNPERTSSLLRHGDEYIRAWTIQLALDQAAAANAAGELLVPEAGLLEQLEFLAKNDASPVVRLYLASALQRIDFTSRRGILTSLMAQPENASDHNLPLLLWYGLEPMVAAAPKQVLADISDHNTIPELETFTYRRLAASDAAGLEALSQAIVTAPTDVAARMITEMSNGLASRPDTPMPASWTQVSARFLANENSGASTATVDAVTALALAFGDANAAPILRTILLDPSFSIERRNLALEGLVQVQDPALLDILLGLLDDGALRSTALSKLAIFDHEATPRLVIFRLSSFTPAEQSVAALMLASRPSFATQLLEAILEGDAPRSLLDSATLRQQLTQLGDSKVEELMTSAWGRSTGLSEQAEEEIARYTSLLTPEYLATADLPNGRVIYHRTCWACHDLFGDGMAVGPGLTGSNRADLDYILTNIIDPSAEVGREYLMTNVTLQDGRVVAGMVVDENNLTITLQSGDNRETVRKSHIKLGPDSEPMVFRSGVSMMPQGQLLGLSDTEVRDLIGYLASPTQVPEAATRMFISGFFNGFNLDRWIADPEVWSVEGGEIVGRTTDGLANNDFACSDFELQDFRLIVDVKLIGNLGNSGIQFRSHRNPDGTVTGLQADIGEGWWGKLYEEHGRGLLEDAGAAGHVLEGEWNTYEIVVSGDRILTALNGQLCVDRTDPEASRSGIIALQVHSGGPTEVRFREFRLELNPKPELSTLR